MLTLTSACMDAIADLQPDRSLIPLQIDLYPGLLLQADPMLKGILHKGDQQHGRDPAPPYAPGLIIPLSGHPRSSSTHIPVPPRSSPSLPPPPPIFYTKRI